MIGQEVEARRTRGGHGYRPDIDGLRAVAVIAVVLFHAGFGRFGGGFVGVDVFFVISGFLITGLIRSQITAGTFTFPGFFVRRMRRLFPALAATVISTILVAAVLFAPDLFRSVGASGVASIASVSNIYFWLDSGYFDAGNALKPLLHTWSLSVEEQFYLVWPWILVAAIRWRVAVAVLAGLFVASIAAGLLASGDPSAVFYLMPFRVYELALGGLLLWVHERLAVAPRYQEVGLLIGLSLIGIAILRFTEETPFPFVGLVPSLGAALVILFGTAPRTGLLLRNKGIVLIGLMSYSIYLVHWPIVVFYRYAVHDELGRLERIALVVAALAAGAVLFRLVETRYRYGRIGGPGTRRFVMAAAGVAVTVGAIGLHAAATGWTWRLGEREAIYLDARHGYGGTDCLSVPCESGQGDHIFWIGDSHARAYFAGVASRLDDRRVSLYASVACTFFSFDTSKDYGSQLDRADRCREARARAFGSIRDSPGSTVVIAQDWHRMPLITESTGDPFELPDGMTYAAFVGRELEELRTTLGIGRLIVIGNVPTIGSEVSPVDCMSRPVELVDRGCSTTPLTHPRLASRQRGNAALDAAVRGFAEFVDPFDALCDERACANAEGSIPLYSDAMHLSVRGAERIVGAADTRRAIGASTDDASD